MKRVRMLLPVLDPFIHSGAAVYAAAACFYVFLSVLPTTILILNLTSRFPWIISLLNDMMHYVIPKDLQIGVSRLLQVSDNKNTAVIISISGLMSLWSSSKGILALTDGLNAVWKTAPHTYLKRRLYAMAYFLLMVFWIVLIGFIRFFLIRFLPNEKTPAVSMALLWLLVSIIYFIPFTTKLPFGACMLGGIFCSSGWILISYFFSVYLRVFSQKTFSYGIIGFLAATGVWANVVLNLFLYGGLIAKLTADDTYHPIQFIRRALRNIHE